MFDSYCIPTDPNAVAFLPPSELVRMVEREFNLPDGSISNIKRTGNSRKGLKPSTTIDTYTLKNALAAFLRREYRLIYTEIAKLIGYKDHTTVVYCMKKAHIYEDLGDTLYLKYYSIVEKLCK